MKDTNNITIIENHVIFVVNLNTITTKARNKNSIYKISNYINSYLSPTFTEQGMRLPLVAYLPGPTAITYEIEEEKDKILHIRYVEEHFLQEGEYHQHSINYMNEREKTLATGTIFLRRTRSAKGMNF